MASWSDRCSTKGGRSAERTPAAAAPSPLWAPINVLVFLLLSLAGVKGLIEAFESWGLE